MMNNPLNSDEHWVENALVGTNPHEIGMDFLDLELDLFKLIEIRFANGNFFALNGNVFLAFFTNLIQTHNI